MGNSQSGHIHFTSRNFKPRSSSCAVLQTDVPLAVVEEILLNVPADQVVRVCRLVCREWKDLVDSTVHWKERCRREGLQPCDASRPPEDWRLFYFLTKKRRNLLKNPKAEDGLRRWDVAQNGGNHWTIEEIRNRFPDNTVTKCFVTSHGLWMKQQLIDLTKEGYSGPFMDQQQPHIKISDWYTPPPDCGSEYHICVELLDEEENPINSFKPYKIVCTDVNNHPWCQMTHVFKNYGPGVRFIRFTHGGTERFGESLYGIRVTNSSVEICPAVERLKCKKPNLLKNPSAYDGLQGWKIICSGDGCWMTEENKKSFPDTVNNCFVTTFDLCLKQQLIDLTEEGYSGAFMDQQQPHIKISDWYTPQWGGEYQIRVELLDQRKKTIRVFQPEKTVITINSNSEPWYQMSHVFKDYGPGVRFIRFTHGGKDVLFWKGHFGMRITNSSVEICPDDEGFSLINRNLLKNPRADDGIQEWDIVRNGGGDGWGTERDHKTFPVTRCFVTSYGLCLKRQLIDLTEEGYSGAFMDQQQPHIKISDWYAPLNDSGSEYQICVELLDEKKKPIRVFQLEKVFCQNGNNHPWSQMTHVFKDYGPGVRFIRFTHGGKNTKFLEGQRGIQVTYSSVEICPV